jgi:hypothetical protein
VSDLAQKTEIRNRNSGDLKKIGNRRPEFRRLDEKSEIGTGNRKFLKCENKFKIFEKF